MKRIFFNLGLLIFSVAFFLPVTGLNNSPALAVVTCLEPPVCQEIPDRLPVDSPRLCGIGECANQIVGCPAPEYPGPCFKCGTCVGTSTEPPFQPTYCVPNDPQSGIQTALGCIPTADTTQFIAWILKFAIGIGGGIAFLLMLIGVFQIITSSGDPERLKAGKELITSALIGLLMIIFSLFLLQLIGVQILQIPGFGK